MVIPDDFAETGVCVTGAGDPPAAFQVMGERSSGTNLLHRLMARQTGLAASRALGWKHGIAPPLAVPRDLAAIGILRDPVSWSLAMHRRPWHAAPALQALDYAAFLRRPWESLADAPRYFPGLPDTAIGQPLQADRDPVTGQPFANLMALRTAKLRALLAWPARGVPLALVRLDRLQADPDAVLRRLCAGLQIEVTGPVRPVTRRLGTRFRPALPDRPATPDAPSAADLAFIRAESDAALEARLGFRP